MALSRRRPGSPRVPLPLSGALASAVLLLAARPSLSWDRVEEELAAAVAAIRRHPAGPEAELGVLEIFSRWDRAGPGPVVRALGEVSSLRDLGASARDRARACLEEGLRRTGDPDAAAAGRAARGFVRDWRVIGPFPDESGEGYALPCPDPGDPRGGWRDVPADAVVAGRVEAGALARRSEEACLCLTAGVEADAAGPAALRLGPSGAFTAWWNGEPVASGQEVLEAQPDRFSRLVELRPGSNRLAVRLCAGEGDVPALYARVEPLPGRRALPRDAIDELRERARRPGATPASRGIAARLMLLSGAVDPASTEARDLARNACLRRPEAGRCLTWAALADDRNERRRAVTAALEAAPESLPAVIALARIDLEGPEPASAAESVRRAEALAPGDPEVVLLRAGMEVAAGLLLAADARARAALEAAPESPAILAAARDIAAEAGLAARELELTERLAAVRADGAENQAFLARSALARGDDAELSRRLELLGKLGPGGLDLAAGILEGHRDFAGAERVLALLTGMAPDDPAARRRQALFLLRRGERERGLAALAAALRLRPQDDRTADYLGYVAGRDGFEAAWTVAPADFPPSPPDGEPGESVCLVDGTAVLVHPSGLASRFRQLVWRAGGPDAARELRRHSIPFQPGDQRLRLLAARVIRPDGSERRHTGRYTVDLSEPWYRLYYDLEAEIIELPEVRTGDLVELRWRVDDTAPRNAYGGTFGDLVPVQEDLPKALWRYAIIAPKDLPLEFAAPAQASPRESADPGDEGRRIVVHEARDVPRCRMEPGVPGPADACWQFHVSTCRTWEDLGRWYEGTVEDRMQADARIRETVRALTAGAKRIGDKVAAVHRWVVTATRYLGLEFGIHGYVPYAAPLVAARGFGDCKDKASLMVTALREAGVEADLALVRTRQSGAIADRPPSLSVFDHAIAYVPALDLWLDGTAELSGYRDLPYQDQGVFALRLSSAGAVPTRTPVLPPEADATGATVRVAVEGDGSARLEADVEIAGGGAPGWRARFAPEETRRSRFEELLAARLPGAALGHLEFGPLDDFEKPVRYRYDARVEGYARRDGDGLLVPADPGLDLLRTHGAAPDRTQPLDVGPRRVDRRTSEIRVPEGWFAERIPPDLELRTAFGTLNLNINYDGNTILIKRVFRQDESLVTASDSAAFIEFCRKVDEALAAEIPLRRGP